MLEKIPAIASIIFLLACLCGLLLKGCSEASYLITLAGANVVLLIALLFCAKNRISFYHSILTAMWLSCFLVYLIQFFILLVTPDLPIRYKLWFPFLYPISEDLHVLGLTFLTINIMAFAIILATITYYVLFNVEECIEPAARDNYETNIIPLYILMPLIILSSIIISLITGVGRMGLVSVYLPFHLSGIIFYARLWIIPALILLLIYCSINNKSAKGLWYGLFLLLIYGLSENILRNSRGALLGVFLPTLILFVIMRFKVKLIVGLVFLVALFTVLSFPIISRYRELVIANPNLDLLNAIEGIVTYFLSDFGGYGSELIKSIFSIVMRAGVLSIMPILSTTPNPLYLDSLNVDVVRYFTYNILQYKVYHITGAAPSFLGYLYIIGGYFAIFCFSFITCLGSYIFVKAIIKRRMFAKEIYIAYVIYFVWIMQEGVLGVFIYNLIALVLVMIFAETYLALSIRGHVNNRRTKNSCVDTV